MGPHKSPRKCGSFREKSAMPSRLKIGGNVTATASSLNVHWNKSRYPPQPAKSGAFVAADLVFFGEGNGKFDAVAAKTSKLGAAAGPVAYLAEGREFIVKAFGKRAGSKHHGEWQLLRWRPYV